MPNPQVKTITADGVTYDIVDKTSGYTTNTGTVTSVGVSNATNGGLSVSGSPVTTSGTITVGHSNVLTNAQTTQAVYPIKIDKNGHISAYGSAVTIPTVPENTGSATTGITISDHSTTTIYGVGSTTTSVKGVSGSTTASHVKSGGNGTAPTLGTAFSIPNVTSAGSASTWSFTDVTVPIRADADTTVPTAASSATIVPIKNAEATSIPNVTAAGSGSASLTFTMDTTDTKKLKIAFSHSHTAPTIGTPISIIGVQSSTTSVTGVSGSTSVRGVKTGTSSTTTASKASGANGTAPTLGTAFSVPNVTSVGSASNWVFEDITVPIADESATTVPIKNGTSTTVVTSKTHTVTDSGHTHSI